ncbi:MAG: hypothetical protein BEN19_07980 [Epulopiscium sp. Nuni2H_MBin003]|nr:MAG: hypothetical protein BEN19_07980 [Epulopiscium sp. Nuni2H_MBin003]
MADKDAKKDDKKDAKKDDKKPAKKAKVSKEGVAYCNDLVSYDNKRIGIAKYDKKMLTDPNRGHWENLDDNLLADSKTYYRSPINDIKDGYIGIDFGTRTTTVSFLDKNSLLWPMRVGAPDLQKPISKYDFELPSIIDFTNIEKFMEDYKTADGRPLTNWADISIAHSATNKFLKANSASYSSFMSQLKKWCISKHTNLRLKDKQDATYELNAFLELEDDGFNPVEIYGYYLGSFINNMYNGVYLKYIISYPPSYELEIADKIVESFKKGIKKSLPAKIVENSQIMNEFSVISGISEPTACAISSLIGYGFEPQDDEAVFYSVFDFGATTTNFNFGLYKRSVEDMRYTYTIDELGVQGNRYLGGEILLELLAYEVFVNNKKKLLKKKIQFTRPLGGHKFMGDQAFISQSEEAKMNMVSLMNKLRPLWEETKKVWSSVKVVLYNRDGAKKKIRVKVKHKALYDILNKHIEEGILDYFKFIRHTCNQYELYPPKVNIFLAGNSSKSRLVPRLFNKIAPEIVNEWNNDIEIIYKQQEQIKQDNTDDIDMLQDMLTGDLEDAFDMQEDAFDMQEDAFDMQEDVLNMQEDAFDMQEDVLDMQEETPEEDALNMQEETLEEDAFDMQEDAPDTLDVEKEPNPEENRIVLAKDLFAIFPKLGTKEAKNIQSKIKIHEDNQIIADMGEMSVTFGVLKGRVGGKINVKYHNRTEDGQIKFLYYVGDSDINNSLVEKLTPHTPYGEWVLYTPATCEEVEIYYTIFPVIKNKKLSIKNTRKHTINLPEVYGADTFIYIRAIEPAKIEYMVGQEDEMGEIQEVQQGEIIEFTIA